MSKKQSRDEAHIASDVTLRLISARQLLQDGWCQGQYKMEDKYCMLGAIGITRPSETERTALLAVDYIRAVLKSFYISRWNDHSNRKHEEVLSVMDHAIASSMQRS